MNAIVTSDNNGSGNFTYISRDSCKSIAGAESSPRVDSSANKVTLTLSKYSQGFVIGQGIVSVRFA